MTDNELRIRLTALDTCALSDALDRLGIDGQALGLHAVDRSFRSVGRAFTVRMLPRGLPESRWATTSTTSNPVTRSASTTAAGSTPRSGATSRRR